MNACLNQVSNQLKSVQKQLNSNMEPRNDYRAKPLRRASPPIFQGASSHQPPSQHKFGGSPLRQHSPPTGSNPRDEPPPRYSNSDLYPQIVPAAGREADDEQKYEERRGEELRRQIREREDELSKITSSKDRLKMRIQNTLSFQNSQEGSHRAPSNRTKQSQHLPSDLGGHSSILKQPDHSTGQKATPRSFFLNKDSSLHHPEPPREIPPYNPSLGGTMSHGGSIPAMHHNASGPLMPVPGGPSEYTSQLQNDNQQLQRRLNLVVAELDRVTRDKNLSAKQLDSVQNEVDQYQRAIDSNGKDDPHQRDTENQLHHQRLENKAFQAKIHEFEDIRNNTLGKLNMCQAERERNVADSESLSKGLTQKVVGMKDLEQRKMHDHDRAKDIQTQILALEYDIKDSQVHIPELAKLLDDLRHERDALLHKLQNLNSTYDHAVHDISRERAQIEAHNRRHSQLMATKKLVRALKESQRDRKQAAMNEFCSYCKFDKTCHDTLNRFTQVLLNCGQYQMKIALKRWFQNALKPIPTQMQSKMLADRFYKQKLALKMMKEWQRKNAEAQKKHQGKLTALRKIWRLKLSDCKHAGRLAFKHWRNRTKLFLQQQRVMKFLIARQESAQIRSAFHTWSHYNVRVHFAIKDHLCRTQYSNSQLMQICFNQLKCRTQLKRRIRLMRLAHYLKGWRDSQAYRRYTLAQNVSLTHLRRRIDLRTLSASFHALRINKEQEKMDLMNQSLNGNYEPEMQALEDSIKTRSAQALKQKKMRALDALGKHARCKLASYFHHWSSVQVMAEHRIMFNLKQQLLQKYDNSLRMGFNLWSNGTADLKNRVQNATIGDLNEKGKVLTGEVKVTTKEVDEERERQQRNARAALAKASAICVRRFLKYGLNKWANRCKQLRSMEEDGAGYFLSKLRKLLCRQGFNLYREKTRMLRQMDRDEERASHYLETRESRLLRKVYNALCQYRTQCQLRQRTMRVLCSNMDLWLQRRGFEKWMSKGNVKAIQHKKHDQNENSKKYDRLNELLGKWVRNHRDHTVENQGLRKTLKEQAQRVIANVFARMYYSKIEKFLRRWRQAVDYQKHRENFVRSRIKHWQQYRFYMMKAAFQNFVAQSRISDKKTEIKVTLDKIDQVDREIVFNRESHDARKAAIEYDLKGQRTLHNDAVKKLNNVRKHHTNLNNTTHHTDRTRAIFVAWRLHTKRTVAFANAIKNALQKSLWQTGFDHIRHFAIDKHRTRVENKHMNGMRLMFWKNNCRLFFDRWRQYQRAAEISEMDIADNLNHKETEEHDEHIEKVKRWTGYNGLKFLREKNLNDIFKAWKNVHSWQRTKKVMTSGLEQKWQSYLAKKYLKRLHERILFTRKVKALELRFKVQNNKFWLRTLFDAILKYNKINKDFCTKLANLASKFDYMGKEDAMRKINMYAENKKGADELGKKVGSQQLAGILHQLYLNRMNDYLQDLRNRTGKQAQIDAKLKSAFGHFASAGLRRCFYRWKNNATKINTEEEVNDQGPVVEHVLREQMKHCNYRNFLKDQAYTQPEIKNICGWAKERAMEHLARGVARIEHQQTEDLKLKPKVFDRWRQYVKHRQVIGKTLKNVLNKLQPGKVDLSYAFNRWKYSKRHLLAGIDRRNLMAKCGNDERHKQQLNALEDSATQFMNQMEIQRDELVENYIKSQRLAVALGRDGKERAQHKAVKNLGDHSHGKKKTNLELILSRNLNLISSLKDRIKDFEHDNDNLAGENEELRQFSLDGYQIAKNVQSLSSERETLSVDLADKSKMIQKLLDQNQELSGKLKNAQEHAISLINRSNHNMRRLQPGAQEPQHHPVRYQ